MSSNKWTLAILSDLHIGNPECRLDLIKKNIRKCKRDSINHVWLGGDLIEYVSKYSVGKQTIPIPKQIDLLVELLEPIKDKIDRIITGNHEERAERTHHINPTENVALRLGLYDRYTGTNGDIGFYQGVPFYFEHALRGGTRTFKFLRTISERLANIFPQVQLYILGHYHKLHEVFLNGLATDKKTRVKKVFLFEGGYVDYWNSFGHVTKHEVSDLGDHKITFNLDTNDFQVGNL